ncbi:hypothetical protein B0T26DRAFT_631486 [Lasiosphaeria miniovina]|uniref:C2H2-type domain-containing protein n=1 Tax=Lasiosphaeria miniovina TaxID=1954250 RepID=A0AA40EER4_9PEZI|nr:uncharacterized protein B0T26DRAFT_631486 [Lasiosphaeria miniovina]KAK0734796.1 hypothetical protein B0T26DRAFT_631486 [Lasiosphaeria miniovina]
MADDDWDLDTDEIRSLDSEELHERRPNRWTGAPSTWASWTRQDRKTHAALETATAQDLAVHLYNAAALKRGRRGQQDEDEDRRRGKWVGERWTAWPLPADEVPSDELLPRTLDKHQRATFRCPSPGFPGSHLEEEVSATMLRFAKERFLRRGLRSQEAPAVGSVETSDEGEAKDEDEGEAKDEDEGEAKDEDEDEDEEAEDEEGEDEDQEEVESRPPSRAPAYTVVPSADDAQSYALLRPASRRILAKLDETLTILHNARASRPRSGDEDGTETDASPIKRGKRSTRHATPKRKTGPAPIQQPPKGRVGRPRKAVIPLEGETEQDMLVRVARERKQRLPDFYHEKKEAEREAALRASTEQSRSASPDSRASSRSGVASRGSASRASSVLSDQSIVEGRVRKCLPRDWHHVMGAAAMAGFSPAVITRATQRCATLFGQGMTMHTLLEQPAGAHGMLSATYSPGPIDIPPSDDSEEELEQSRIDQPRAVSRQSMRPSLPEAEAAARPSTPGPAGSLLCPWAGCPGAVQGYSRLSNLNRHVREIHGGKAPADVEVSEAAADVEVSDQSARTHESANMYLCPWPDCPRGVKGFSRKDNLSRHLQEKHGGGPVADADVDSEDEVDGAVHVDGFLHQIKTRSGWRGKTFRASPRRRSEDGLSMKDESG